MKLYLKFIKIYLNFLSVVNPNYGGKIAIKIFQKVNIKKIKPKEEAFYQKVKSNTLEHIYTKKEFNYYELGSPNGKLVFLVHGWDSNAGSLLKFAFELAQKEYRVISIDLPSHAYSEGTHTNLFICKDALINLINHINPKEEFSIIGHSFGAAVATYTLAELNLAVNKIVLLSANNIMRDVFKDYQKFMGFNEVIYTEVCNWVKNTIDKDLDSLVLTDKLKQISYNSLLIIHDKYDKVLAFKSALEIKEAIPESILIPFEKIGHYRMLWNDDVVRETINFIDKYSINYYF
jgi:pimeloyl-ACP methyl ester carboxylesterase